VFILYHLTAPLYLSVNKGVISVNRTVIGDWRDEGLGGSTDLFKEIDKRFASWQQKDIPSHRLNRDEKALL
jgi:hypothetical protein